MKNIKELRSLSQKLNDYLNFVPTRVEILSKECIKFTEELVLSEFQLASEVKHQIFYNETKDKLFIFWDHENIDKELKGFFNTLIRVLKFSGTTSILILDECISLGKIDDEFVGIYDHINFTTDNPLIGSNYEEIGTRFPDMSHAYSDSYFDRFGNIKKVVLAGVDDFSLSDKTMSLIKQSEAEVYNFSVMWMNILAVHSSISFSAVCKIK